MPFGRTARPAPPTHPLAARPLIVLGALGTVTALALSGCSTGSPADDSSSSTGKLSRVTITLTNDGSDACAVSTTKVPAGPVTFTVHNESSTAITEVELLQDQRILGEKENLAPGLDAVRFTATLSGGEYPGLLPGCRARAHRPHRDRQGCVDREQQRGHPARRRREGLRDLRRRPGHRHGGGRAAAAARRGRRRPRRGEARLRGGPSVLRARRERRRRLRQEGVLGHRQRRQPRLPDRHARVEPRRRRRLERLPRRREGPVPGRRDHRVDEGDRGRTDRRRRAPREARAVDRVQARGPGERRGRAARGGPVEQDHGRGGGVQPHRPRRPRRERRGCPTGLRVPQARPDEGRPGADEADRHAVRHDETH